ncbi:hypothetical protein EUX98_g9078 [Antrodiella citrinella]|uniref:Reverse transcriptase domain-containing protein n=1 Tax=Antrodiella citrinella TaxID=2447956 RepID=A0A4S4M4A3_9APHY|nr:hypothetical protein EUX98_g9078 [Antrodiella citrinella]
MVNRPQSVGGKDLSAFREPSDQDEDMEFQQPTEEEIDLRRQEEAMRRGDENGNGRDRTPDGEGDDHPVGEVRSPTADDERMARTHTPTAEAAMQTAKLHLLNDIMQLSPEKQNTAWRILGLTQNISDATGKAPAAAAASTKLFTVATEKSGDLFSHKPIESLPQQVSLISHGFHLPLTACTSTAVKYMRDNPGEVKYKRLHNPKGVKLTLLDTSSFPVEIDMQPEEWRDAWRNFMQVLNDTCDSKLASSGTLSGEQDPAALRSAPDSTAISAPSAVPPTITPLVSGASERDRVITPYNADIFEEELRRLNLLDRYPLLAHKFRYGFPIGDFDSLAFSFNPPNHSSATEHLDFITAYIDEQVSIVVDKAGAPGKYRLVQNCSYKNDEGVSVNSQINSDDFSTRWGTAAQVAEIISTAPLGAQAASLDIDSAFRNIPILPAHKKFLVIQHELGEFFIDHVCPFGIASGPGIQGEPMDAVVDIIEAHDIKPNKKWVDDLINFRFPLGVDPASGAYIYAYGLTDIFRVTAPLGVPWHPKKITDYSHEVVYLGFLWNLETRTVSLPDTKHEKYTNKLVKVLDGMPERRVSQKDLMSINGTLSHITFVYPHSRSYLTNLCTFIASYPNPYAPRFPPKSVVSDLRWWLNLLQLPRVSRPLESRGALLDLEIWVDTSTSWGIGILVEGQWDAWKWKAGWKGHGRDIGWAEMIAVELTIRVVECLGHRNAHILIRSDNSGVVGAFSRGRSRNFEVNLSIRRTEIISMSLNLSFHLTYVNTKDNLADPVSQTSFTPSSFMNNTPSRISAPASASARLETKKTSSAKHKVPVSSSLPRQLKPRKPRKPKPCNSIDSSSLRPLVLADERLALWTTPYATKFRSDLASDLSHNATSKLFSVMLSSLDSSTRKNYGAGLLRFTQFCDCLKVAESDRMPASDALLAAFVAEWSGSVARTTVDTWLAGLGFWHSLNGAPWNGGKMLKATCTAVAKTQPTKKPKRPPVTLEHMHALRAGLDLTDSFDAAVLGELVIPSTNTFNPSKHVSKAAAIGYHALPNRKEYASFHIPWTKTTKQAGADIVATENDDATSAITALRHHQNANHAVPSSAPLFAFETADQQGWAPMTKPWFLDRCNEVWNDAGLELLTGHCFRIGGATELLLRGTHPDIVATQGGWKSRAFLEYWRKIESILPLFISQSFDKSRLQLVQTSMDAFKKKYH